MLQETPSHEARKGNGEHRGLDGDHHADGEGDHARRHAGEGVGQQDRGKPQANADGRAGADQAPVFPSGRQAFGAEEEVIGGRLGDGEGDRDAEDVLDGLGISRLCLDEHGGDKGCCRGQRPEHQDVTPQTGLHCVFPPQNPRLRLRADAQTNCIRSLPGAVRRWSPSSAPFLQVPTATSSWALPPSG